MKVSVMKPRFKPKTDVNYVLYPYYIFHIRLHYKRLGLKDKIFNYFGYVDLYRFGMERGDSFIDIEEWEVDEKTLMEPVVKDYEEIKQFAMKKAVEWGALRVVSWWHPLVEIVREQQAYKIFWVYKRGIESFLMDSFNGQEYPINTVLNNVGCARKTKIKRK